MKTKSYRVTWEIDVDASSPRDAAEQALAIHRDPFSTATVFTVKTAGRRSEMIDLEVAWGEEAHE
jgi:hypothetical protein